MCMSDFISYICQILFINMLYGKIRITKINYILSLILLSIEILNQFKKEIYGIEFFSTLLIPHEYPTGVILTHLLT